MKTSLENFWQQLRYEPQIINASYLNQDFNHVILCGMGGSHLAADILRELMPTMHIFVHHDYDLPKLPRVILEESLYVINSYSGNTEETLSSLRAALAKQLPVLIITTGGELERQAKTHSLPHILVPNTGIQPRTALGLQIKALLSVLGNQGLSSLATSLCDKNTNNDQVLGKYLADAIGSKTPLVYTSNNNSGLGYYWKITLNETAKIPAFCNTFPEINHNEFTSFDTGVAFDGNKDYHIVFLKDDQDSQKIKDRMEITASMLAEKKITNSIVMLSGKSILEKRLSVCVLAMWTAWHMARETEAEAEQVPMVESFKHKLANK